MDPYCWARSFSLPPQTSPFVSLLHLNLFSLVNFVAIICLNLMGIKIALFHLFSHFFFFYESRWKKLFWCFLRHTEKNQRCIMRKWIPDLKMVPVTSCYRLSKCQFPGLNILRNSYSLFYMVLLQWFTVAKILFGSGCVTWPTQKLQYCRTATAPQFFYSPVIILGSLGKSLLRIFFFTFLLPLESAQYSVWF